MQIAKTLHRLVHAQADIRWSSADPSPICKQNGGSKRSTQQERAAAVWRDAALARTCSFGIGSAGITASHEVLGHLVQSPCTGEDAGDLRAVRRDSGRARIVLPIHRRAWPHRRPANGSPDPDGWVDGYLSARTQVSLSVFACPSTGNILRRLNDSRRSWRWSTMGDGYPPGGPPSTRWGPPPPSGPGRRTPAR